MRRRRRWSATIWLAAALVCGACEPNPSAQASPASGESLPAASELLPTPLPSPLGSHPTTPASSRAIVRLEVGGDIGPGPQLSLVLYDDGSLLDLRARPALTVTQLTASGVAIVVDRIKASGLFTTSRNIPWTPKPMGYTFFVITLADGADPVRVSASNQGDDPDSKALVALAEGLRDNASWLPPEAFPSGGADPRPYQARSVRVTSEMIALGPDDWTNAAQSIHRIDWPLEVAPGEIGDAVDLADGSRHLRCGIMDAAQEIAIRKVLARFEVHSPDEANRTTGWYIWLPDPALLRLTIRPFLPDEVPGCSGPDLPGPPALAEAPRLSLFALLSLSAGGLTPSPGPAMFFVQGVRPGDGATLGHVAYFPDGTILFEDPPTPAVGIGARRLSPSGLAQIQSAIDATGLLRKSYTEVVPDDVTPNRMYSIVTHSVVLNGSDRGVDPVATRIARLARKLLDPVSWLPSTAWAGNSTAMQQYRPASVHLQIYRDGGYTDPVPPLAALSWPLAGAVESFGAPDETLPGMDARAADLSVDEALRLLGALAAAHAPFTGLLTRAEYVLSAGEPGLAVKFEFSIEAGQDLEED